MNLKNALAYVVACISSFALSLHANVSTVAELVAAVNGGNVGDTVTIDPGEYVLDAPLVPKTDMTITGAGIGLTIIKAAATWQPGLTGLPTTENPDAFLFNLDNVGGNSVTGVTLSHMTLTAPDLHGAIFADAATGLEIHHIHFEDFQWASIRAFRQSLFKVHNCVFVDAGGRVGNRTAGALYTDFTSNSEFWNNRFYRTPSHHSNFFGIKGEQIRFSRIHHNTIEVSFSLEFPFRNDEAVEIDHNFFAGVVSIPKFGGGPVFTDSFSYNIHHNVFKRAYSIELARNHMTVSHNLFDFDTFDDGGNLFSNFGSEPVPGPLEFHNNLVSNPGRGVFWSQGTFDQIQIYNNHIRSNCLTRDIGLFGFNGSSDFTTIEIRNNIIENTADNPRPLVRNSQSNSALIENNLLLNISDTANYTNTQTGAPQGLVAPLVFNCGVNGEFAVNGWDISTFPERIEAESYDRESGTTTTSTSDIGGGGKVTDIDTGDWIEFDVVVPRSKTYNIDFRLATANDGRQLELFSDSVSQFTLDFDSTGGVENWVTQSTTLDLVSGPRTLRISANQPSWDINWFFLFGTELDAAVALPAFIEAENFVSMSGVQTQTTTDTGGGENVGFINPNDFMEYHVTPPLSGSYTLDLRVASNRSEGGEIWIVTRNGLVAKVPVPFTGGWQNWVTLSLPVTLNAGPQAIRLWSKIGGWNINWFELSYTPYSLWRLSHFTEAQFADTLISGDLSDPEFDGLSNFLEYAFGGNPFLIDSETLFPTLQTTTVGSQPELTLQYPKSASELTFRVERSFDLSAGSWEEVTSTENYDAASDRYSKSYLTPPGNSKAFLRMTVQE